VAQVIFRAKASTPTEFAPCGTMHERFPAWLHREAGIVKAVIDWA
jgi:hypothetical protein